MNALEVEILHVLAALPSDRRYGVPLRVGVAQRFDHHVSYGALYAAIDRLRLAGYLTATQAPGGADRSHRVRLMLEPTVRGVKLMQSTPIEESPRNQRREGEPCNTKSS